MTKKVVIDGVEYVPKRRIIREFNYKIVELRGNNGRYEIDVVNLVTSEQITAVISEHFANQLIEGAIK